MENRIKELRLKKGLTLKQVADAIGVSEATVQRYESGKIGSLKYEKAEALAKLFNVSPGYLMGWDIEFSLFGDTPEGWTKQDQEFSFNMIKKYGPDTFPNEEQPSYYLDPEVAQLAQELYERPEMRVLFDASRNASPEDIEQVAALLEKLSNK